MTDTKEYLIKAKELLTAHKNAWAWGSAEITRNGKPCYCAGGAIAAAVVGDGKGMYESHYEDAKLPAKLLTVFLEFIDKAEIRNPFGSSGPSYTIQSWNDGIIYPPSPTSDEIEEAWKAQKKMVLSTFDKVIAAL